VPDGAFVVAAERDQFGPAADVRRAYPDVEVAEVAGADHFFEGSRDAVGMLVAARFARMLVLPAQPEGPRPV